MALLLYRYRHALRLNFTMLRNLCWTRYLTNFYKISIFHWVSIGNFIFINFFPKCSCEAVKCLYFSWPGADMVLHALPCTFVHLPLVYRTPRPVFFCSSGRSCGTHSRGCGWGQGRRQRVVAVTHVVVADGLLSTSNKCSLCSLYEVSSFSIPL